jgi:hypothetical protein
VAAGAAGTEEAPSAKAPPAGEEAAAGAALAAAGAGADAAGAGAAGEEPLLPLPGPDGQDPTGAFNG